MLERATCRGAYRHLPAAIGQGSCHCARLVKGMRRGVQKLYSCVRSRNRSEQHRLICALRPVAQHHRYSVSGSPGNPGMQGPSREHVKMSVRQAKLIWLAERVAHQGSSQDDGATQEPRVTCREMQGAAIERTTTYVQDRVPTGRSSAALSAWTCVCENLSASVKIDLS